MSGAAEHERDMLLLRGRLLPLTATLLLVEGTAVELASQWADVRQTAMAQRDYQVTYEPVGANDTESALLALQPLSGPSATRFLFLPTRGRSPSGRPWTLFLDNYFQGTDLNSPLAVFASRGRACLGVTAQPHTYVSATDTGYHGHRRLTLAWPTDDERRFEGRTVAVRRTDSARWEFFAAGPVQPFERPETYTARRTTDRVTVPLLREYAAALGARPWDKDFYDPSAGTVLARYTHELPPQYIEVSLADAQESRATAQPFEDYARHPRRGRPPASRPPHRLSLRDRLRPR